MNSVITYSTLSMFNDPTSIVPDDVFQRLTGGFIEYLRQTPSTAIEKTIMQRRLLNTTSIDNVVSSLHYILGVLIQYGKCPLDSLHLRLFVRRDACQLLQETLDIRGVGPSRVHALFL